MYRKKRKGKLSCHSLFIKKHKGPGETITVPLCDVLCGKHNEDGPKVTNKQVFCTALTGHSNESPVPDDEDETPDKRSRYNATKSIQMAEWNRLRNGLLTAAFCHASPQTSMCHLCDSDCSNIICCNDCGPMYFVCQSCAEQDHIWRPLHKLQIWTVSITLLIIYVS